MKKIKVLTITTSGLEKKEGISTIILDYFSRLNSTAFCLEIVASGYYNDELVKEFQDIGVVVKFLPSRKNNLIDYIKNLYYLCKNNKYDIVYLNGSSSIMSIELIIAILTGCKIRIVHSHNTSCEHRIVDKILRPIFYFLYTDAFACGNDAGKWLFGGRDFKILSNGRDIDVYKFDATIRCGLRDNLGLDSNDLVIGHVGNFNKQKNHQFLIEVFKELLKIKNNAKLFLIGTGNTMDAIKEKVRLFGIEDNVVFTGSIDNVSAMMSAMDVMVLPSLHEGLPLVVIEAQIAALPCIVSDVVTKECCYTDLVKFESLSSDTTIWVKDILEVAKLNRVESCKRIEEKTVNSGFCIRANTKELEDYLLKRYREENR